MKILRYSSYNKNESIVMDLMNLLSENKSDYISTEYNNILVDIINRLNLNTNIVSEIKGEVNYISNLVKSILKNTQLNITLDDNTLVFISLSIFLIIFVDDRKNNKTEFNINGYESQELLIEQSKSILEELKLMGIGNGIIKKLIQCMESVLSLFNLIYKSIDREYDSFIDLTSDKYFPKYIDSIILMIDKYKMDINFIINNFNTFNNGINYLIKKLDIKHTINNTTSDNGFVDTQINIEPENNLIK